MRFALVVLLCAVVVAGCASTSNSSDETYHSIDVTMRNAGTTIGGTLTVPDQGGPFPAVVLVPGGGKQNRDEEFAQHKPFLVLADALSRAGYAVLRTDDRGVGATSGDKSESSYDDLASDVLAQIAFLRERSDIDPARIGVLGHSQGGALAPLVARKAPDNVAFVVLMAGPAQTGCEVLKHQMRVQLQAAGTTSADRLAAGDAAIHTECDLLRAGNFDEARKNARAANQQLPEAERAPDESIDKAINQEYASQSTYDPEPALRALRIPTLALFGTKDVQVDAKTNDPLMRTFLADNPRATVHTFEGANHLMQSAETGMPDEYARIETTMDPAVLDYLKNWLHANQ
ncbi:alpha/beta fold hydrolase [Nocardia sp. 2]|uniref:Alpha/beta fold hydrolase n=1 Tax=Nocardia acididurans TaxID=2802282 RepID=A0ABS1M6Y7_9NOCA|nr:alpha/beta hydrolase [Nocardia acididurans]MBL1076056.1 alpha/beta fold hydrolase [Nocardia acididurans]